MQINVALNQDDIILLS